MGNNGKFFTAKYMGKKNCSLYQGTAALWYYNNTYWISSAKSLGDDERAKVNPLMTKASLRP